MSANFENLKQEVLNLSENDNWNDAVTEWELDFSSEDKNADSECVCGKKNIRYLHRIKNIHNGNELKWIGSECIKKFNRTDFDALISIEEKLFRIGDAIRTGNKVDLNGYFFSKKTIKHFYDNNVFEANQHNNNDPSKDYDFLLSMFNKGEARRTERQERKIYVLINNYIIPYVRSITIRKK